jgi:hypothetical protein
MGWDPASLSLRNVKSDGPLDNQQLNVALTIGGQGFDTEDSMRAILVRSGCPPTRENVIPLNDLKLVSGDHTVTAAICTKHKAAGSYDLVWWLTPPPSVSAADSEPTYVPVSDVTVLPSAIEISTKN